MNFHRLSGALLVMALPFAVAGSAGADASSSLTLTVTPMAGPATVVQLRCEPAGGTHPSARRACRELRLAGGNFDALPGAQLTDCTMEYLPVTATAEGTWRGDPVSWQAEYGNDCTKVSATGVVFDF